MYVLLIIATLTRFGTIGGAGIAMQTIEFGTLQACQSAARAVVKADQIDKVFCLEKGKMKP